MKSALAAAALLCLVAIPAHADSIASVGILADFGVPMSEGIGCETIDASLLFDRVTQDVVPAHRKFLRLEL